MLHLWLTIYQNMAVDRHDFYDHRILIVVGRRQQKDFSKRSFAKLEVIYYTFRESGKVEGVVMVETKHDFHIVIFR